MNQFVFLTKETFDFSNSETSIDVSVYTIGGQE